MVQWAGIQGIISYGNCWFRSFHHHEFASEYGNRFILTLNLSFSKPQCTLEYRRCSRHFQGAWMCVFLSSCSIWRIPVVPWGAVSMQPHPHTAQSHPRHRHIFRETRQEPSGGTLRGKKQYRASVGFDSCPRTRNPLDLPSGSHSSSLRQISNRIWVLQ